ncbi:MAG: HAD-IB family hydrolase, partial [Acinetobacter sp.]|nr:HAD-IB family hydrolase [Acinetobacter sp.]
MHAQNQKPKTLALFDFDGTLYLHDSFTGFIFYALRKRHIVKRGLQILPWIQAYYLNFYPAHRMRPKLYASMF